MPPSRPDPSEPRPKPKRLPPRPKQGAMMKPTFNLNVQGTQTDRVNLDHLLPTHGCKWSPYGTGIRRLPTFVYHKPIYPDQPGWNVTYALGTIKLRDDGRWSWWRRPSPHATIIWRAGQGVALTRMCAMHDVQEGWITQQQARLLPLEPTPMADVYEYLAPPQPNTAWYASSKVLGRVIDTHTGVYTWQRSKSKHHSNWKPGCGRATSLKEASMQLMEGWE